MDRRLSTIRNVIVVNTIVGRACIDAVILGSRDAVIRNRESSVAVVGVAISVVKQHYRQVGVGHLILTYWSTGGTVQRIVKKNS